MTVTEIRTEIKRLIDEEKDPGILEAIKTLLKKTTLDPILKMKLSARALRSNEDIEAGRLLSREEMEDETNDLI